MTKEKVNRIFSDDEIIRSVKEGHLKNYELIVERYKGKILNFIYRMIFDHEEAENLTQDVFLKIYININRYKEQDSFSSYIYRIAKNLTLNFIKKRSRIVNFSSLFGGKREGNFRDPGKGPVGNLEKSEKELLIIDGLKKLGEEQRLALVMKIYLNFSYAEISGITNWSIPKIESLISRAKKRLISEIMQDKNS